MSFSTPLRKSRMPLILGLLLVLLIGVVLAVAFLTQTVPPTAPGVLSGCSTLTLSNTVTPPGTSGVETLTCGTSPALTSTGGTATPAYTLPTGYISLAIASHGAPCSSATSLTPNTPATVAAGNYDYCATYSNAPNNGLGTFTVSWA